MDHKMTAWTVATSPAGRTMARTLWLLRRFRRTNGARTDISSLGFGFGPYTVGDWMAECGFDNRMEADLIHDLRAMGERAAVAAIKHYFRQ